MKPNVVWLAIFFLSPFSGICFASDAPKPYIEENGCPGHEDCRYGDWRTTKEVTIVQSPSNPKVIAKVAPGQTIHVETGDVYITPLRIDVLTDHKESVVSANDDQNDSRRDLEFKAGNVLYWMNGYAEQGVTILFKNKEYVPQFQDGVPPFDPEAFRKCSEPSKTCWARITDERPNEVWWVKVKTKSGLSGWVRVENQFRLEDQFIG